MFTFFSYKWLNNVGALKEPAESIRTQCLKELVAKVNEMSHGKGPDEMSHGKEVENMSGDKKTTADSASANDDPRVRK